jgi:hypothetical protein
MAVQPVFKVYNQYLWHSSYVGTELEEEIRNDVDTSFYTISTEGGYFTADGTDGSHFSADNGYYLVVDPVSHRIQGVFEGGFLEPYWRDIGVDPEAPDDPGTPTASPVLSRLDQIGQLIEAQMARAKAGVDSANETIIDLMQEEREYLALLPA